MFTSKKPPPVDWSLETAQATFDANDKDLQREEDRMRTVDGKLTQLAAFSGLSISISASLGANAVLAHRLKPGFQIALGATLVVAIVLLLATVVVAFSHLSPKLYSGIAETAVLDRTRKSRLGRPAPAALAKMARTTADVLVSARKVNDRKAEGTRKAFALARAGFALLAVALALAVVGAVV